MIDGKHFHNCRYTKCTLIYEGGEWAATNTAFDQCQITFSGPAARTLALMAQIGIIRSAMMPQQHPAPASVPPAPVH